MTDTNITDAVVFPEDDGTGVTDGSEDYDSAGHFGLLSQHQGGTYVGNGLTFDNIDTTNETVDIGTGHAFVEFDTVTVQSGSQTTYDTTLPDPIVMTIVLPTSVTLQLDTDAVNDIYLATDPTTNDGAYLRHGSAVSEPTDPFVDLGTVDTSNGSTTRANDNASPTYDNVTTTSLHTDDLSVTNFATGAHAIIGEDGGTITAVDESGSVIAGGSDAVNVSDASDLADVLEHIVNTEYDTPVSLRFGSGVYTLKSTANLNHAVHGFGAGKNRTIIQTADTSTMAGSIGIDIAPSSDEFIFGFLFVKFAAEGRDTNQPDIHVRTDKAREVQLLNTEFRDAQSWGIQTLNTTNWNDFRGCWFLNGAGFDLSGVNDIRLIGNRIKAVCDLANANEVIRRGNEISGSGDLQLDQANNFHRPIEYRDARSAVQALGRTQQRVLDRDNQNTVENSANSGTVSSVDGHPRVQTGTSAGQAEVRFADRTYRYAGSGMSQRWSMEIFLRCNSGTVAGQTYVGTWFNSQPWESSPQALALEWDGASGVTNAIWGDGSGRQSTQLKSTVDKHDRIRIDYHYQDSKAAFFGDNDEHLGTVDVSTNQPSDGNWTTWPCIGIDDGSGGSGDIIATGFSFGYRPL